MGMLQGKIVGDAFIVIDVFALPVEGTETRVNAQAEAYEYMVDFADSSKVRMRAGARVRVCSGVAGAHVRVWLCAQVWLCDQVWLCAQVWLVAQVCTCGCVLRCGCKRGVRMHESPVSGFALSSLEHGEALERLARQQSAGAYRRLLHHP